MDGPNRPVPFISRVRLKNVSEELIVPVLANKEFEAWFLAGASSLAGHHGFPADLAPPPEPESIRGAKEWLTKQRKGKRSALQPDSEVISAK
jgi:hypothetical protein